MLGLAFHPKYKENGEFFVFYTLQARRSIRHQRVSRFRVSKDDPNKADPASEEDPAHASRSRSGTTTAARSPSARTATCTSRSATAAPATIRTTTARTSSTLLGKILRIDVDHKDDGKNYAIPKDNPFVGTEGRQAGDLGLRPPQHLADVVRPQDRPTAGPADVGQNLWEEINIVEDGRQLRLEPPRRRCTRSAPTASGPKTDLIEPIWEYHHDIGKSITGGNVYRGKRLPELDGHVPLRRLRDRQDLGAEVRREGRNASSPTARSQTPRTLPIMSFGEDEQGDVYLLTYTPSGRGIYRFVAAKE